MKTIGKFTSLLLQFVGRAASLKNEFIESMMAQGVEPLLAHQVKELFSGVTETHSTPGYTITSYYSPDGKIYSKAKGVKGEYTDEGVWRVNESGSLCGKYLGKWGGTGKECFMVYPGKSKYEFVWVHTSGVTPRSWTSGIMPIIVKPGI